MPNTYTGGIGDLPPLDPALAADVTAPARQSDRLGGLRDTIGGPVPGLSQAQLGTIQQTLAREGQTAYENTTATLAANLGGTTGPAYGTLAAALGQGVKSAAVQGRAQIEAEDAQQRANREMQQRQQALSLGGLELSEESLNAQAAQQRLANMLDMAGLTTQRDISGRQLDLGQQQVDLEGLRVDLAERGLDISESQGQDALLMAILQMAMQNPTLFSDPGYTSYIPPVGPVTSMKNPDRGQDFIQGLISQLGFGGGGGVGSGGLQ